MNKILKGDSSGFIPIAMVFWLLMGLTFALSWVWIAAMFAFGAGMTGYAIVKLARKDYFKAGIILIIAVTSLVLAYCLWTGAIVI